MKWSTVQPVLLIALLLLTFVLAFGFGGLGRKVDRVEQRLAKSRRDSAYAQDELAGRIGTLSSRIGVTEGLLNTGVSSSKSLRGDMKSEIESIGRSVKGIASSSQLRDLRTEVRALKEEVARVGEVAEAASRQKPAPSPTNTKNDDTAKEIANLSGRLDAIDSRLDEMERKIAALPSGKVQVNEEALRKAVSEIVQEEVNKVFEEMRTARRRR